MTTTDKPPPMPASPPKVAEAIRVKRLWFPTERDVPLIDSEGGLRIVKAGPSRKGTEVSIQYEPWQRHHRVREVEDGKIRSEFCVPESWALYEPDPAG